MLCVFLSQYSVRCRVHERHTSMGEGESGKVGAHRFWTWLSSMFLPSCGGRSVSGGPGHWPHPLFCFVLWATLTGTAVVCVLVWAAPWGTRQRRHRGPCTQVPSALSVVGTAACRSCLRTRCNRCTDMWWWWSRRWLWGRGRRGGGRRWVHGCGTVASARPYLAQTVLRVRGALCMVAAAVLCVLRGLLRKKYGAYSSLRGRFISRGCAQCGRRQRW